MIKKISRKQKKNENDKTSKYMKVVLNKFKNEIMIIATCLLLLFCVYLCVCFFNNLYRGFRMYIPEVKSQRHVGLWFNVKIG